MKKINRRDYLMRMGVGAGAIIGAATLDGLAFEPDDKPSGPRRTSAGSTQRGNKSLNLSPWKQRSSDPPPMAPRPNIVRLIFYGLMGLSYRMDAQGKSICDVGFHASGDSTHHHRLSIYAYQKASCETVLEPPPNGGQGIKQLSITTEKPPTNFNEAYFYQPGDPTSRQDLADNDFRWIIDFESDYMYRPVLPQGTHSLEPRKGVYRPTLSIPFGLFYTLRKTNSTFRVQTADGKSRSDLFNVADVMGASIFVEPGTAVKLTVNKVEYSVVAPGEIYFINYCCKDSDMTQMCETEPYNIHDKKKRNDFYLQYKAFKRPTGRDEYELLVVQGVGNSSDIPGLSCVGRIATSGSHSASMERSSPFDKALTDEAPCAASGFGGGGGLPPFP